jgi:hypothetical protein
LPGESKTYATRASLPLLFKPLIREEIDLDTHPKAGLAVSALKHYSFSLKL